MEKIQVVKVDMYRDGGTTLYKDKNNIKYYQDNRILSKTKGSIYSEYPKDGSPVLDVTLDIVDKL